MISQDAWPKIVDTHFHDGAGRVLRPVWPIKPAINTFMTAYDLSEVWCLRTHDHTSLTTHWRSFSWWGMEGIAICLPIKAARNSLLSEYNLSVVWFSTMHDQTSLTLLWRSFCHGSIHNAEWSNLAQSIIHIVLAAFLVFSFTFFLITMLFFNNTLIYIIMICKIACLSVNARHQLQDRSIRCSGLQNEC